MDNEGMVNVTGEVITEKVVERTEKGRFLPGHKKLGGLKKGTIAVNSWIAREVAQSKNFNPLAIALDVFTTGYLPLAPGEDPKKRHKISDELRVKVLLDTCKFLFPTISAMQVSGANEGPIAVASLDMVSLMRDPRLVEAAQALSLATTAQYREQLTSLEPGGPGGYDPELQ
jgi:hypothetical protein